MNVGELFVSLGIKGGKEAVGVLNSVTGGLKRAASESLLLKASLFGAIYATQRLFDSSGKAGTALENFDASMEMSTKTLQQYQYVARQVGISNEEMAGTFQGLSKAFLDARMGKPNEALKPLSNYTGRMGQEEWKDLQDNPAEALQILQGFVNQGRDKELTKKLLTSMGIGGGVQAALFRNKFTPEALNAAPTYSESQIQGLDRSNAAWIRMFDKIEKSVGKLNAAKGEQIANDIGKIVDGFIKLGDALVTLADKLGLFDTITQGLNMAADLAGGNKGDVSATAREMYGDDSTESKLKVMAKYGLYGVASQFDKPQVIDSNLKNIILPLLKMLNTPPPGTPKREDVNKPSTVNQTNNFYGPANPKEIVPAFQSATQQALSCSNRGGGC